MKLNWVPIWILKHFSAIGSTKSRVKLVLSHFLSVKWSAFQTFWEPYLIFSYFSGFFLQTCIFCNSDIYVLHLSYALQFSHITIHKNCLYRKVFSIFSTGLLKKVNFNCLLLFFLLVLHKIFLTYSEPDAIFIFKS